MVGSRNRTKSDDEAYYLIDVLVAWHNVGAIRCITSNSAPHEYEVDD